MGKWIIKDIEYIKKKKLKIPLNSLQSSFHAQMNNIKLRNTSVNQYSPPFSSSSLRN